jgi:hypothetical protein
MIREGVCDKLTLNYVVSDIEFMFYYEKQVFLYFAQVIYNQLFIKLFKIFFKNSWKILERNAGVVTLI